MALRSALYEINSEDVDRLGAVLFPTLRVEQRREKVLDPTVLEKYEKNLRYHMRPYEERYQYLEAALDAIELIHCDGLFLCDPSKWDPKRILRRSALLSTSSNSSSGPLDEFDEVESQVPGVKVKGVDHSKKFHLDKSSPIPFLRCV